MSTVRSLQDQLPSVEDGPAWFAFRTAYKREKRVAQRLGSQGIVCYVPLKTEVRHYVSKRKVVQLPLLNTYIFVRITARDYVTVLSDVDVYEIVRFGDEVGKVSDREISFLKTLLHEGADEQYQLEVSESIVKGMRVVVTGGALAGTLGTVVAEQSNHNFQVELTGLGLGLRLVVDPKYLAAAP